MQLSEQASEIIFIKLSCNLKALLVSCVWQVTEIMYIPFIIQCEIFTTAHSLKISFNFLMGISSELSTKLIEV